MAKSAMRDRVRQRAKERDKKEGSYLAIPADTTFIKLQKGNNVLDFVPYVVSEDGHPDGVEVGEHWYRRVVKVHYKIGPSTTTFVCPTSVGKACPVCEEVSRMYNDKVDKEDIKPLRAKERVLFNVINLNDKDKGVQLLESSHWTFGKSLDKEIDEGDEDNASFPELVGGLTVKVRMTEASLSGNTYLEPDRWDFTERKDYNEGILKKVIDLDSIVKNVKSYDEVSNILYGADEEASEKTEAPAKETSTKEDAPEKDEAPAKEEAPECPAANGTFGHDVDSLDECTTCSVWEACTDLNES